MNHSSSYSTPLNAVDKYPESRLYCSLEGTPPAERLIQRLRSLEDLGLLESESIPVFEEATQMAARFLKLPICILSVANDVVEIFKAAVGLSQLGLMNPLAKSRQLDLSESFGVHIIDSQQTCVLHDITEHPALMHSQLVQNYGIRAYAGVPLFTSQGQCIGTLAVMALAPQNFSEQEIAFLELTARWAISEYERAYLQTHLIEPLPAPVPTKEAPSSQQGELGLRSLIDSVRLNLIGQLTEELRSPLTSVIGMAGMLSREIYGPLTSKQREYTEIIRSSSQALVSLVEEVIELGAINETYQHLTPSSIDIEMLGQQVIKTLEQIAEKREQRLTLTIEPGPRVWVLDRSKVKQLLYHLMFSVIQMAGESSVVRLHASRRDNRLNLAIWLSNPWLGEGLPQSILTLWDIFTCQAAAPHSLPAAVSGERTEEGWGSEPPRAESPQYSRELLGLLLSRHLAEVHGGSISIQGTSESGYRFIVSLPSLVNAARMMEFTT
ncbi:MAG TPA: GAF domain-containing sensor histidine kinase [Leptolyngbyaceae cyanobacterium]